MAAPLVAGTVAAGTGSGAGVGAGAGMGIGAASCAAGGSGAGAGAGAGTSTTGEEPLGSLVASAGSAMMASSPPTGTTASSPATMRVRTPEAGEGISVSTLSVETSSSGSSAATVSPSAFSQRVTVPSVTLSPSWGIVTETGMRSTPRVAGEWGRGDGRWADQPWACNGLPASTRCASPTASDIVGCGWMRAATSSAYASQL